KNLSLLHAPGLDRRMAELKSLHEQFGKVSHAAAIEHAHLIRELVSTRNRDLPIHLFQADATEGKATDNMKQSVDLVMADVPYGDVAQWVGGAEQPIPRLLAYLLPGLSNHSLVVMIADKQQRI